jgi:hypothetical protein
VVLLRGLVLLPLLWGLRLVIIVIVVVEVLLLLLLLLAGAALVPPILGLRHLLLLVRDKFLKAIAVVVRSECSIFVKLLHLHLLLVWLGFMVLWGRVRCVRLPIRVETACFQDTFVAASA